MTIGSRFWRVGLVVALTNCHCSRETSRAKAEPGTQSQGGAAGSATVPSAGRALPSGSAPAGDAGAASVALDRDAGGTGAVQFPADWCARLGGMNGLPAAIRITNTYNAAVSMDCATAGLTSAAALTDDQYDEWRSYLQIYTFLMAGCRPLYDPPEGGIRAFGPGNTPIVGSTRGPLSTEEVTRLTNAYVLAFAAELGLTPAEQDAVRAYLLLAAGSLPSVAAVGSLTTCPRDAGP